MPSAPPATYNNSGPPGQLYGHPQQQAPSYGNPAYPTQVTYSGYQGQQPASAYGYPGQQTAFYGPPGQQAASYGYPGQAPPSAYPGQRPPQPMAVQGGLYDAGARFDGVAQPNIPPPPPGYAPNAAQMASAQGHSVVMGQEREGYWGGARGAGYTWGF